MMIARKMLVVVDDDGDDLRCSCLSRGRGRSG
jgi:hypothetical protein